MGGRRAGGGERKSKTKIRLFQFGGGGKTGLFTTFKARAVYSPLFLLPPPQQPPIKVRDGHLGLFRKFGLPKLFGSRRFERVSILWEYLVGSPPPHTHTVVGGISLSTHPFYNAVSSIFSRVEVIH